MKSCVIGNLGNGRRQLIGLGKRCMKRSIKEEEEEMTKIANEEVCKGEAVFRVSRCRKRRERF